MGAAAVTELWHYLHKMIQDSYPQLDQGNGGNDDSYTPARPNGEPCPAQSEFTPSERPGNSGNKREAEEQGARVDDSKSPRLEY
jgi:hypothetical protein